MDRIRQLLREVIGLDSSSLGETNLNRLIAAHMLSLGENDSESYWLQLKDCSEARARLVESVVIGETWFYRDAEAFEPILERARNQTDTLRVLSLPCASGEEPYSLAIALITQGTPNFEIDGLDVSERALERARLGLYGPNSFRGPEAAWKTAFFVPSGDQFEVRESVRKRVRLLQANVANPQFLDELGVGLYDAIVFRNLSIYLEPLTRQLALAQFHQHLKPGGWLCVAPSESDHIPAHLFRRSSQVGVFEAVRGTVPQVRKLAHPRKTPRPISRTVSRPSLDPSPPEPISSFQELLESARQQGDQGNLVQATRLCHELLARQGPHPDLFHLLAALASARGDLAEQERQLRKVLYLQPDHSDALLHLASLLENSGDRAQADRLRGRARRQHTL